MAAAPSGAAFWLDTAVVAGSTALVYQFDRDAEKFFNRNKSGFADGAAKVGEALGNGLYVLPLAALGYAAGRLSDDEKVMTSAKLTVEGFAISGILVNVIKYTAGRKRPASGEGPGAFHPFDFSPSGDSFPSGHAATAFAWAGAVAGVYQDRPLVQAGALGLATLTALSRVYQHKHWASDVVAGSLIGYFTGRGLASLHGEGAGVTVLPAEGGATALLTVRF